MKLSKRKITVLFLMADALLITLPVIATESLTYYYRVNGMPVPNHWWFVPYTMGAGFLILIGLIIFDVLQRIKKWFDKTKSN
jgi:hypothetical protein